MKKTVALSLIPALFVFTLCLAAQTSQEPFEVSEDDVLRVSTSLVTVPVSVFDRSGRFVPDLRREQFKLFENGVEQEVAYFEGMDKPFTVALLLDTSDSTRFKLEEIQRAAAAFLDQLRPADRVLLIAFDSRVRVLSEATSDRDALRAAIKRAETGGGTSLYEAVETSLVRRMSRIPGRKAVVLFTDGVDTSSTRATYLSTLRAAEELDALVYSIQYDTYDDAIRSATKGDAASLQAVITGRGETLDVAYKRAALYTRLLADKTGGRHFRADTLAKLNETFERIAKELRQQYSLGYYPKDQSADTLRRKIKVRVDVPGAAVRARQNYIFRPPGERN